MPPTPDISVAVSDFLDPDRVVIGVDGHDDGGVGTALAEALERQLQTRVRIVGDAKKGRVEVHYASEEDLKRIGRLILEGE